MPSLDLAARAGKCHRPRHDAPKAATACLWAVDMDEALSQHLFQLQDDMVDGAWLQVHNLQIASGMHCEGFSGELRCVAPRACLECAAERACVCRACMQVHLLQTCRGRLVATVEEAVQSAGALRQNCVTVQQGVPVTLGRAWMVITKALQPAVALRHQA